MEVPVQFELDISRAKQASETELRQILGDFIFEGMSGSKCRREEKGQVDWGNSLALQSINAEERTDVVVRFALSFDAGTKLLATFSDIYE
jgi:hypothetical protein